MDSLLHLSNIPEARQAFLLHQWDHLLLEGSHLPMERTSEKLRRRHLRACGLIVAQPMARDLIFVRRLRV